MLIAIVGSRGLPASYGGFESLAEDLALNWSQRGIHTCISGFKSQSSRRLKELVSTSPTATTATTKGSLPDNVHLVSGGYFPLRYLRNAVCTYRASHSILKNYQVDFVLVLNAVNILSALRFRRAGVPVLLHMDGQEQKRSGLPRLGRWVHRLARKQAIASKFPLVVDSDALRSEFTKSPSVSVIKYAPHLQVAERSKIDDLVDNGDYFIALARYVPENQITIIIEAFLMSGSTSKLLILGQGTGTKNYEKQIRSVVNGCQNVLTIAGIYDRGVVNALLQNAKAYVHGHSVGGTNPILVDARFHAKKIFCHENRYNREGSGAKEFFWLDARNLTHLFQTCDQIEVNADSPPYVFESQESIATHYRTLLTQIKVTSKSALEE